MTEGIFIVLLLDFLAGVFVGFLLARRRYRVQRHSHLQFDERLRR